MTRIEPHPDLLDDLPTLDDVIDAARTLLAIASRLEDGTEERTDEMVELTVLLYDIEDLVAQLEALKP